MKRIVVRGPSGHQRSIGVRFDESSVTNFGGLLGFKGFVDSFGWPELEDGESGDRYSLRQVVETLLYLRVAGVERLSHADDLAEDPLLKEVLGERPSVATLFRRLARDGFSLSRAFSVLRDRAADEAGRERRGRRVLALDSTALTVFGDQELAAKGYNLERRGAKGYQPLVAACVADRMIVGGFLRPGNATSTTDADGLINDLALRYGREVEALMDAGFYGDGLLSQMESLGWNYVVSAPGRATLMRHAAKARFEAVQKDVEVAEFAHQTRSQEGVVSRPRRYVVVRRFQDRKDATQQTLLDARPCEHFFYVTNLTCSPAEVWRRYNQRAQVELVIRDLKESFALGCIPSSSFDANAAHLQLCFAAYNLLRLFASKTHSAELALSFGHRLRALLIRVAARVIYSGRAILLAFSVATPRKRLLEPCYARLARLVPD